MVANTSTVSRIPKDPKIETNCANARKGFSKILAGIVAKNQNEIQEYINARATQEKDDITEYEQKLVASIQEKLAILAQLAEDPK